MGQEKTDNMQQLGTNQEETHITWYHTEIFVFVYLCICVFVHLCICIFVYFLTDRIDAEYYAEKKHTLNTDTYIYVMW